MRIKYVHRGRSKKHSTNNVKTGQQKRGRGRPRKCHKACGKVCIKLPDLLYQLPGCILSQLTARPLHTITRLEFITSSLKQVHTKPLFQSLANNATALTSLIMDGNFWSGHFTGVADEMSFVLGRCSSIKLVNFKETPEFWRKCMDAAANKCEEFAVVECNGLKTVVSMLPGLIQRLISLELIQPDLDDFAQMRTKNLIGSFLQKISLPSKLVNVKVDNLWSLLLDVPPEDLLSVLSPLRSLSFCRTSLSLSQLVPLLQTWEKSAPVQLAVEGEWGCWSQVPSMVLLPAISNISSLSFRGTRLELSLLEGLLSSVGRGSSVKVLDLRGNDLSNVPQHTLLLALTRLQVAVLTHCSLGEGAVRGVLQLIVDGGRGDLEEIYVTGSLNEGGGGGDLQEIDVTGNLNEGGGGGGKELEGLNEGERDEEKEINVGGANCSLEYMVKLARKGSGMRRLEVHSKMCRCDGYSKWCSM